MRATIRHGYGEPNHVLSVAEIDEPEVGDDQVLVQVHAASVNPADWHLIEGAPYLARLQIGLRGPTFTTPGSDVAGTVKAVGAAVTGPRVGDDVFGTTFMQGFGAFAEQVVMPAHLVVLKPIAVSFDEAAAVPLAALTAMQGLRDHGHVEPGQKVLVIGASGGVGTFAVQIAKALGAEVTGVCSTRNVALVADLGADHVIDYTKPDALSNAGRYDVILQAGGTRTASECRRILERDGTLVQISGDSPNRWFGPLGRILRGQLLSSLVSQTITTFTVQPNREDLEALATLLAEGKIRSVIDTIYALDQVDHAISHVEQGHTRGKVIVRPGAATTNALDSSSAALPLQTIRREPIEVGSGPGRDVE